MKGLNNWRISQRRRPKRHGPKRKTFVTRLRLRSDGQMALELPGNTQKWLGKGVGGRLWFYVSEQTLHITGIPRGPHAGKRHSTRIRISMASPRHSKRAAVDGALKFKRRSNRVPAADVAHEDPGCTEGSVGSTLQSFHLSSSIITSTGGRYAA